MTFTRRFFLKSGLGAAGGWLAARDTPASASTPAEDPYVTLASVTLDPSQRLAIINADDFGIAEEVDRGIVEALDRGIVTSASLLVEGPHAAEAVRQVRQRADVSLGIHVSFDAWAPGWPTRKTPGEVRRELDRQMEMFIRLVGAPPTHIDSHHHAHRIFNVASQFLEVGRRYGVPVRGFSDVFYVGRFWGQPEFGHTDMSKISVDYLLTVLRSLRPGISEVSCHPGRPETRSNAEYNREREVELRSLCDAKMKATIADEGIRLISFREYARLASSGGKGLVAAGCSSATANR